MRKTNNADSWLILKPTSKRIMQRVLFFLNDSINILILHRWSLPCNHKISDNSILLNKIAQSKRMGIVSSSGISFVVCSEKKIEKKIILTDIS